MSACPIEVLPTPAPHIDGRSGPIMRLVPVDGDSMTPTLRKGDAVGALPVNDFSYDGLYVVDVAGVPRVFRCSYDYAGGIDLVSDNKFYSTQKVPRSKFAEIVIGQVAMLCNIVDRSLVRV